MMVRPTKCDRSTSRDACIDRLCTSLISSQSGSFEYTRKTLSSSKQGQPSHCNFISLIPTQYPDFHHQQAENEAKISLVRTRILKSHCFNRYHRHYIVNVECYDTCGYVIVYPQGIGRDCKARRESSSGGDHSKTVSNLHRI